MRDIAGTIVEMEGITFNNTLKVQRYTILGVVFRKILEHEMRIVV